VERGLRAGPVAERVGIPRTHVSAIELGVKFPNLMTVLRLAAALECRVTEIVSVFDGADLSKILQK
jgi:transcriptional regulator with XRE-family HTH domain